MVLSNKKLKQRLRSEAAAQQHEDSAIDKPNATPATKREKKRQLREQIQDSPPHQPVSPATAIDQAELDTYRRCIHALIHKHDEEHMDSTPKHIQEVEVLVPNADKDRLDKPNLPMSDAKSRKRKKTKERSPVMEQQEKAADQSVKDQDSSDPRTVYVGGIPYYSSEDDIKAFFGDCGTISEVNLKTFSDSGKFRGIALLTFKTVGGAERALALDGANMGDRFLKVQHSAAKPKELVKNQVYNGPPSKTEGYTRAYIGNLSWNITEEDIREFFKDCKVDSVRFSQDKITGDFQGFGHVDFADDRSLELALQRDQEILLERPIKVAYAVPKKSEDKAGKDKKDITCYSCGHKGHISSRCPHMGRG